MSDRIVVGSRESLLAVAQSMTLVDYLRRALPNVEVTLMTMKTTGDRIQDRTLDKVGGKGLFVKELDAALREGRADLSVHSLKDVPMQTPEDLPLVGFSRREDPRDALVLPVGVRALKRGGVIGTSSLRRALQLKSCSRSVESGLCGATCKPGWVSWTRGSLTPSCWRRQA